MGHLDPEPRWPFGVNSDIVGPLPFDQYAEKIADDWHVALDGRSKVIPFLTGDWCTASPEFNGRRSQLAVWAGRLIGLPAGGLQRVARPVAVAPGTIGEFVRRFMHLPAASQLALYCGIRSGEGNQTIRSRFKGLCIWPLLKVEPLSLLMSGRVSCWAIRDSSTATVVKAVSSASGLLGRLALYGRPGY